MLAFVPLRRPAPEEAPATVPNGDLDLLPGAIILWVGSVVRVITGTPAGEAFRGEAALALFCVVVIPCWALWSWIRLRKGAEGPPADDNPGILMKS